MRPQTSNGQRHRRICSRSGHDARTHQPSAIEHDPHGLAAFGLILARNQVSAARACRPADIAHVVAFAVIAQAFEVAPEATLPCLAKLDVDLAAACEEYLLLFACAQGWINADGLLQRGLGPTLCETQRRAIAYVELACRAVAAFLRFYAISDRCGNAREGGNANRFQAS